MRRLAIAVGGLLAATATALAPAPAAAAQATGTVYVVHGIPDTPVDVYVDGQRALDDFQPGTTQGPVDLPAGTREIAIFPADAPNSSGSPLLSASPELPAGANVTLVAHLDAVAGRGRRLDGLATLCCSLANQLAEKYEQHYRDPMGKLDGYELEVMRLCYGQES
jgi:hypothetical protein